MRISDWSSDVCSSDLYPEWDLTIWGEGPMREALEQQVQDAGLAARIVLPGRTSQPWQELDKADMFALTSRVEGFPNVLLEAMALGCACVTVDRSEEHTSELQSLMRISYAVFCLKK